jgi:hypothetical protein
LSVTVAIALAALVSAGSATLAASPAIFGMNYNFLTVDKTKLALCASKSRAVAVKGQAFLVRYQDPGVRQTVLKALAGMRKAGFEGIRVFIWFAAQGNKGGNLFDIDDPSLAMKNVSEFASDVKSLGYTRLYLAFGPQGNAKVTCRQQGQQTWGDCFDSTSVDKSVSFILSVRRAIDSAPHPALYVDLQSSGGVNSGPQARIRDTMGPYLTTLVKAYSRQFPHDQTSISMSGRHVEGRIGFVMKVYSDAGTAPSYLDFHIYDSDPATLAEIGDALRSAKLRLPVVVGESAYGDPRAVAAITSLAAPYDPEGVPIFFWPLRDVGGDCGVDTAPPYDLTWLPSR